VVSGDGTGFCKERHRTVLDWHTSVYGSRTGGAGGFGLDSGDDEGFGGVVDPDGGVTYGSAEPVVSEQTLRQLGGKSFYRAYDVIETGRIHDFTCTPGGEGTRLSASVDAADQYADDYRVEALIDENHGEILDSSCTCPAFGRFGSVCKHVVALIMQYNDKPQVFRELSPSGFEQPSGGTEASHPSGRPPRRTSRALMSYMHQQDSRLEQEAKNRQLDLLKEVNSRAAGDADGTTALTRHMPIGSVTLRPMLEHQGADWYLHLHICVPAKGISYVVKDVRGLIESIGRREFVSYGKKLAFVHSLDSFDERSRAVIAILSRAIEIRRSVSGDYAFYQAKAEAQRMRLSDDETAEILDQYVDQDVTLDYSGDWYGSATPVSVVDGDPDLGLVVEATTDEAGGASDGQVGGKEGKPGYVIRHDKVIEQFVVGRVASYVIVHERPEAERLMAASSAADDDGYAHAGVGMVPHSRSGVVPIVHRCSKAFVDNRPLLTVLCGAGERGDLYLNADDIDEFSRTVLPDLEPVDPAERQSQAQTDVGGVGMARRTDGAIAEPGTGHEGNAVRNRGVAVRLPEELLASRRVPCVIETYLDRDKFGITCDVQARYGDDRFHVFSGIAPGGPVVRDKRVERLAVEAVRQYFPEPEGPVARINQDDEKAMYRLISEGLPVLRGLGEVFSTPAFDGLTNSPHPVFKIGLSVKSGLVEVSAIADEIDPADVPALLDSYRKRRKFHRLRDGSFVNMADVDTSKLDEVSADLGIKSSALDFGSVSVPAYQAYYLDHEADQPDKSVDFRRYIDGLKSVDPDRYRVPLSLENVLRPYQMEGFRWLNAVSDRGFGGILADEMGLGKTVQTLAFLLARRAEQRRVGPDLIVCPASLVYNWAAECDKFAPDLQVSILAGSKDQRRAVLNGVKTWYAKQNGETDSASDEGSVVPDVLITSYDLLRRDIEDYHGLTCYAMVLDEAQYIKNHATKSSRAVRSVDARHRFALTGTPIENRLSELWSIFDFLMPGMLGTYKRFRERFEQPIMSGDPDAEAKLQASVGPFILRRLKSQVLKDLPDKIENVITVRLEGEQRRLYAALEQQLRATVTRQKDIEFKNDKIQVLAQLTRLRQACCDPRLLFENVGSNVVKHDAHVWGAPTRQVETAEDGWNGGEFVGGEAVDTTEVRQSGKIRNVPSAKLDAIAELVSSCRDAGRKMLIFSQFTGFLDLIAQRLRREGVSYDMITGATPKRKRLELVDKFNKDDTPVFLISLKAGNTGLNLTGACVVVHADPWWNAAAQEQATDRAHRIGQTQDVNVYQIVAKDTIEERILKMQQAKSDLATRFVNEAGSGSATGISDLSKEDLLELLG
jgi:SNF2 family DNA or RNA helicase